LSLIYSNFDNYYRNIARFNCDETAYLGKDGKPLPTICKATYAGINPVDLSVARKNYMKELGDLEYRAKTREALELVYAKMPKLFLKNCTRSRSKKRIVDIDVDIDENLITDEVRRRCFEYFLLLLKNNVKLDIVDLNSICIEKCQKIFSTKPAVEKDTDRKNKNLVEFQDKEIDSIIVISVSILANR
jgi:hypothetical protein